MGSRFKQRISRPRQLTLMAYHIKIKQDFCSCDSVQLYLLCSTRITNVHLCRGIFGTVRVTNCSMLWQPLYVAVSRSCRRILTWRTDRLPSELRSIVVTEELHKDCRGTVPSLNFKIYTVICSAISLTFMHSSSDDWSFGGWQVDGPDSDGQSFLQILQNVTARALRRGVIKQLFEGLQLD